MKSDDGSYWGVMSGTSMATPTVAGIIALWLQANPNLSVMDIKNILAQTSIKDHYTRAKHDQFGPNGKIDALEGMQLVLKNMKVPLIGDVNGDEAVNINDVTCFISYLLSHEEDTFDITVADMNGDGTINISDLTMLISYILRGH